MVKISEHFLQFTLFDYLVLPSMSNCQNVISWSDILLSNKCVKYKHFLNKMKAFINKLIVSHSRVFFIFLIVLAF